MKLDVRFSLKDVRRLAAIVMLSIVGSLPAFGLPFSPTAEVNTTNDGAPGKGTKFSMPEGSADIQTRQAYSLLRDYLESELGFVYDAEKPFFVVRVSTEVVDQGVVVLAPDRAASVANALIQGLLNAASGYYSGKAGSGESTPNQIKPLPGRRIHLWQKNLNVWFLKPDTEDAQFQNGIGIMWQGQLQSIDSNGEITTDISTSFDWLYSSYPYIKTNVIYPGEKGEIQEASAIFPKRDFAIDRVYYTITNAPSDWWSASASVKPSLFYNFKILFHGNVSVADFDSVRVYLPNTREKWWTIDIEKSLNIQKGYVGGSNHWHSVDESILPIGVLTAEIKLKDGTTVDYPFTMGKPGDKSNESADWVFSPEENAEGQIPSSVSALGRPEVLSFSKSANLIKVRFKVHGQNVHNGLVFFYDKDNASVGRSAFFRDRSSGSTLEGFDSGKFDNEDLATNSLTLKPIYLMDETGNPITNDSFARIEKCRVEVVDGVQYEAASTPSFTNWDYRAVSIMKDKDEDTGD